MQFIPFHRPFGIGALLRLAVAAVAFGVLLSWGGPWEGTQAAATEGPTPEARQGSQSDAPTEEPVASLEVALKHYQELLRAHRDAILASGYADVRPVSTALEEAVRAAFEVAGSFEGARKLLEEAVSWQECPRKYDSHARDGASHVVGLGEEYFLQMRETDLPRVFYAKYPTGDSREVVVLMNSLLTREQGTDPFWLQTWPYALIRTAGSAQYKAFGDKLYNSPVCDIVPLGVVAEGIEVPTFVYLNRITTRSQIVELHMRAVAPGTDDWSGSAVEWDDINRFTYDGGRYELTLWERDKQDIVNVVQQIEKWGPQRAWRQDAPKPGAVGASPASDEKSSKAQATDGTPDALRQAITNHEAAVREAREHLKDGGSGYRWTAKTDLALKELVQVAFGQFGELEAVKTALGDRVRWQPVPRVLGDANHTQAVGLTRERLPESALDESPTVYVMTYRSTEQDTVITVMLNTFATWDQSSIVYVQTDAYAAGRVDGRPFSSSDITGTSKITPQPDPFQTYQLAGFVEAPGSLPAAVYFTQARGATFCACILNPENMTWTLGCYDEGWDTEFWGYSTEDHIVGLEGTEAFDVGKWVREWVLEIQD